jgi:hypothetical protein
MNAGTPIRAQAPTLAQTPSPTLALTLALWLALPPPPNAALRAAGRSK